MVDDYFSQRGRSVILILSVARKLQLPEGPSRITIQGHYTGWEVPMKKFLLGSVALFALSAGPALAADMPAYKAAPYAAPSYYNWSGYYIGFNIGGQWDHVDVALAVAFSPAGAAAISPRRATTAS